MRDIPVRVVNALYELHRIIEKGRKNYDQLEMGNDKYWYGNITLGEYQVLILVIMPSL
jgi:hypothetical protein